MRVYTIQGLIWLCALLGVYGCEENLDPQTPEGALHALRDALMEKDVAAILEASSETTQSRLSQLHTRLVEQRTAIEESYPEEHRSGARNAYPKGTLEAEDSRVLFAVLIEPKLKELKTGPGLKRGLSAQGSPTISDKRASLSTLGGETLEFVLGDDGHWRTTAFEQVLEQSLNQVKQNEQILAENLKVFEELKRREAAKKAAAEAEP